VVGLEMMGDTGSKEDKAMTTIYCDEAGNTGANLLDSEQPLFILASNDLSAEEANSLLEHVRSGQGGEPKFSTLRRRPEGIAKVIRLLADPRLNGSRAKISVFHKRYMVVQKLVDLVAENLFHAVGEDLYKRGANIAMSNLLYYCMPTFCGQAATDEFVELIRQGPAQHKAPFYAAGAKLVQASQSQNFKANLTYFTDPELFDIWYGDFDWSALDPAIPALFHHIVKWGEVKDERFHVLHDRSKPILASQETFESMMAGPGEESVSIGTDRRKIHFPLRALTLSQGDSTMYPQLQVADICAGALNHFYKCHIGNQEDELSIAVEALGCLEWGSNFILPQPHVTPDELGTANTDGTNSVDAMVNYLRAKGTGRK
jgi:hypothetical protein